jgi:2-deoxy-D-gluconate 3-dehydrogenase
MAPPVLELFSLKNKIAIVTGATGGIGVDVSVGLAEAGADIVSLERPNDSLAPALRQAIEATGRSIRSFECDIRNPKSIQDAFTAIWQAGIIPDILVNIAGVTRHISVEDTRVEDISAVSTRGTKASTKRPLIAFLQVLDINFRGTYLAIQEFGRELLRLQRPGKIINYASFAAILAQTNISLYASSKGAVRTLTTAVSNEWAGRGITCNAICPG